MQFLLVLLLFSIVLKNVSSVCDEFSHRVICDTLPNIQQYDTDSWTDLRIGDSKILDENPFYIADDAFFSRFRNLHTLTIVNEIKSIRVKGTYAWLDYLNLFGNNIEDLNVTLLEHFPDLRKVSFRKNKINNLFYPYKKTTLKVVDVSENKMVTLGPSVFANSSIIWLSLKRNKLTGIGPGAFPTTLLVLHLDYNNIYILEEDILQSGNQLQEFTISHNEIVIIPKLTNFPKLKLLDLSYNHIAQLADVFSDLSQLNYLDLSYNKISKIDNNFRYGPNQYYNIRISLAFNRLMNLDYYALVALYGHKEIDTRTNNTLSIYGNPLCCECLSQLHIYFFQSTIKFTKCENEFYNSGKAPSCITTVKIPKNRDEYPTISENDLQIFLNAYETSKENVGCDLRKAFYQDLNILLKRSSGLIIN